jgi:CHAD domain-containing protein
MAKGGIKWDERRSASENARRVLPGLAAEYFGKVRQFLEKDHCAEDLHRMRLDAKRLRYTLELFRPCYGKGLEERLDALKKLQDSLGDVNDAVATRALLGKSVDRNARKYLNGRADEKAEDFRKHWKESFDSDGQEKWWKDYLRDGVKKQR